MLWFIPNKCATFNDEAFDAALLTNEAEPFEICQQSSEFPNLPLVASI